MGKDVPMTFPCSLSLLTDPPTWRGTALSGRTLDLADRAARARASATAGQWDVDEGRRLSSPGGAAAGSHPAGGPHQRTDPLETLLMPTVPPPWMPAMWDMDGVYTRWYVQASSVSVGSTALSGS